MLVVGLPMHTKNEISSGKQKWVPVEHHAVKAVADDALLYLTTFKALTEFGHNLSEHCGAGFHSKLSNYHRVKKCTSYTPKPRSSAMMRAAFSPTANALSDSTDIDRTNS